jgi:hypothetical protein
MRESERSPAAWATRRGPFDEMSGGDNFETKRQAQDFQVRQPPLKRAWPQPTPGITRHSEAIHLVRGSSAKGDARITSPSDATSPTTKMRPAQNGANSKERSRGRMLS